MFNNIQALRGIAALLVVFLHSLPHFKAMGLSNVVFESIAKFGYVGVDIFFVISGFVMAKTTIGKPSSLFASRQFIFKRFLRIFLGFWPILILAIIYLYIFNPSYLENKEILQSFLLINANMFDLVIPPAWSLTFELYFYLLIAILISSPKFKPQVLFSAIIFFIILKLIFVKLGENKFADFFLSSLILEFIAGYVLFKYIDKLTRKKYIFAVIVLSVGFLYTAIKINIGYGYVRTLTFGVFSFLLVWLLVSFEVNKIIIIKGLFKLIGDSSYTLYLTHTVLLGMFYTIGLRDYFVSIDFAMWGFVLYILSIVLGSWIFYRLIEHPLYSRTKKILFK